MSSSNTKVQRLEGDESQSLPTTQASGDISDPLEGQGLSDPLSDPLGATQFYAGAPAAAGGSAGVPGGPGAGSFVQAQTSGAVQFGILDSIGEGLSAAWDAVTGGGKTEGEKQFAKAEEFASKLKYGDPYKYTPSTGIGGFDCEYWPLSGPDGWEKVIMRVAVDFTNPVTFAGGQAVPYDASDKGAKGIADGINALPKPADRQAEVAKYTWGGEKKGWMKSLESVVFQAWSFEHSFRIDKPGWKWLGADPSVDMTVKEGAPAADDHVEVKAFKLPPGVDWASYNSGTGRDQFMELGSNDVQTSMPNNAFVFFEPGQSTLTADGQDTVEMFTRTYQGDPTHAASVNNKITLIGRSSASGSEESNRTLAQARIDAVKAELTGRGWSVATRVEESNLGESEADQTSPNNRDDMAVEMVVQGEGQNVAVHEFGHAFGLLDEYANKDKNGNFGWISGTGGQAGQEAGHSQLVKDMGIKEGAIFENSENIMSVGDKVKPQHYATFHEALTKTTGNKDWKLGKAITKEAARAEITPAEDESGS